MLVNRSINDKFYSCLDRREIIIVYGARKIGKTSFLKNFIEEYKSEAIYFNCENPHVEEILNSKNIFEIKALFGKCKYICLDEAQRVRDIGSVLNLIYDQLPEYKLIATASSSFELVNKIEEPLDGKHQVLRMNPLTLKEIHATEDWLDTIEKLNATLVFGMYPEVYQVEQLDKKKRLGQIVSDEMFNDILKHSDIRQSKLLRKILKHIAFSIGSVLSTNNIANELNVARLTVERYLELLEKSFIIFSLKAFNQNLRNELKKSRKYYFYDNGLRNAIVNNFNNIVNRSDGNQLWENFCVSEIMKQKNSSNDVADFHFWKTYDQAEIDLVEDKNGKLNIWEFKWKPRRKPKFPSSFINSYNIGNQQIVTPKELYMFLD